MSDERQGRPSCSELPQLLNCAGYLHLKRTIGPQPERENPDADLGTKLHAILERDGEGAQNLKKRERWVVEQCLKIRDGLVRQLFDWAMDSDTGDREQRYWINVGQLDAFSGKVDFSLVWTDEGLVCNYKTTQIEYESSDESHQLLGEAVVFWDHNARRNIHLKKVYAAIIQPLVSTTPTVVEYSAKELERARTRILASISTPIGSLLTPGRHCKFCPCAAYCPEAAGMAVRLHSECSSIQTLAPDRVAYLIEQIPVVTKIMEQLKTRAKELAVSGQLPGYEMKPGYNVTDVTDPPGFYAALNKAIGLERNEFWQHVSVTKGELKEQFAVLWAANNNCTKAEGESKFDELVAKHGTTRKQADRLTKVKS